MLNNADLLELLNEALGETSVNLESTASVFPSWDSLGQLSILSALDRFTDDKTANIEELATARSVKEIRAILQKAGLFNDS